MKSCTRGVEGCEEPHWDLSNMRKDGRREFPVCLMLLLPLPRHPHIATQMFCFKALLSLSHYGQNFHMAYCLLNWTKK